MCGKNSNFGCPTMTSHLLKDGAQTQYNKEKFEQNTTTDNYLFFLDNTIYTFLYFVFILFYIEERLC